jgi:hypothetical protein
VFCVCQQYHRFFAAGDHEIAMGSKAYIEDGIHIVGSIYEESLLEFVLIMAIRKGGDIAPEDRISTCQHETLQYLRAERCPRYSCDHYLELSAH